MKKKLVDVFKNVLVAILGITFFCSVGLGFFQYKKWEEQNKQKTDQVAKVTTRLKVYDFKTLKERKNFLESELNWGKNTQNVLTNLKDQNKGHQGVKSALENYILKTKDLIQVIDSNDVFAKAEQKMREFYLFGLNRNYKNVSEIAEKYFNKWKIIKKHILKTRILDLKNWSVLLDNAKEQVDESNLRVQNKRRILSMIEELKGQEEKLTEVISKSNSYIEARQSVNLFANQKVEENKISGMMVILSMIASVLVAFLSLLGMVKIIGVPEKSKEIFSSQVTDKKKMENILDAINSPTEIPELPLTDESIVSFEEETFEVNELPTNSFSDTTNLTSVVQEIIFDLSPLTERLDLNVQFNNLATHMVKGNHMEIYDAYEATLYEIFTYMDNVGASKDFRIDIKETNGKTVLEVRFHTPGFNAGSTQLHHTLGPIDKKLRESGAQIGLKNVYSGKADLMYSCVDLRFEKAA
ncbi:MAG: hypothetical protein H6622_05350 [Halobacteriovoraceae bacterium]|nr:hypothetical protein [Halobacteriovoraceae bacterium]